MSKPCMLDFIVKFKFVYQCLSRLDSERIDIRITYILSLVFWNFLLLINARYLILTCLLEVKIEIETDQPKRRLTCKLANRNADCHVNSGIYAVSALRIEHPNNISYVPRRINCNGIYVDLRAFHHISSAHLTGVPGYLTSNIKTVWDGAGTWRVCPYFHTWEGHRAANYY